MTGFQLTSWTESPFRPVINLEIMVNRHVIIQKRKMWGLVTLVVSPRQCNRRQQIETYNPVGLGILDWLALAGWFQPRVIRSWNGKLIRLFVMLKI